MVVALATLITAAAGAQSPEDAGAAVAAFENQVQDYARMRQRLEDHVGQVAFGMPVAEINRIVQGLSAAIRAERRAARPGDLFAPAVAQLLTARINDSLIEHDHAIDDVRAASRVAGVDYRRVRLDVNDTFPWILGTAMFPCVIEVLPPLPPELQYRIVGDDLVLIDIHANLIVDILPSVLSDWDAHPGRFEGGS